MRDELVAEAGAEEPDVRVGREDCLDKFFEGRDPGVDGCCVDAGAGSGDDDAVDGLGEGVCAAAAAVVVAAGAVGGWRTGLLAQTV